VALHTSTEIYAASFDLLGEAIGVILQMRRDAKALIGAKIIEGCIALDLHIRAANMAHDKEPEILRLLERLEVIELLTRTCRDRGYISPKAYASLIDRTQSIGKQANGWRKSQGGAQQRQLPGC
jgi:hypothetical protein